MVPEKTNTQNILYEHAKKTPYLEDHDHVFRSDGVFSPEIQREYFGDKENFRELSPSAKQRFFEKVLADYLSRGIDPSKIQDPKMIEKMEEDLDIFLQGLGKKYLSDYAKLESFTIERGILKLKITRKLTYVDLVREKVGEEDPRKKALQKQVQADTEKLRESITTESYMGGSLIVTYEKLSEGTKDAIATTGLAGVAGYVTLGTGQAIYGITREAIVRIRRIGFRNQYGRMEFITPGPQSDTSSPDTKSNQEKRVISQLQNQGVVVSTPGKSFSRSSLLALSKTKLSILNLSYESYLKETGQKDTREIRKAFSEWKNFCLQDIAQIESAYQVNPEKGRSFLSKFLLQGPRERSVGQIAGRIAGASMHWLFWPVFWKRYHANAQDSATLYASLAETGLFMAGASIGARTPGVLKPIASIAMGGLAVVGGEVFGGSIGLDKKWWKLYPDREDKSYKDSGKDGKSLIGNLITMGELHALGDISDADIRIGKREGWDIRVPKWMNSIPGMEQSRDITLPHIDILRKSVDLNTPPWEWMSKSVTREKTSWNKEVERYSANLRKDILSFIDQYEKKQGIFRDENILRQAKSGESFEDAKKRVLRQRLEGLFPSGTDIHAHNFEAKSQIIDYTIQLISDNTPQKESSLSFFIDSTLRAKMYLENGTLINQARIVRQGREDILSIQDGEPKGGLLYEFADEFSTDPQVRNYILSLFQRIRIKKRLVDTSALDQAPKMGKVLEKSPNGYWIETPEFLGQKGKKWVNTEEWKMFQGLLDSKEKVSSEVLKLIFGENISRGDVFYRLLNLMVENKRREDFIKNVVTNEYGNKWKLF